MLVTCDRAALLAAVKIVLAAVAARPPTPTLGTVKLAAAGGRLVLTGTDAEVGVRYDVPGVAVGRPGAALLPPHRLAGILAEAADAEVTIDAGPETTVVRTGTGRFELPAGDPGGFPDVPAFDEAGEQIEVAAGDLRTLLKRVAFAAETRESTRFAVTGVLWEADAANNVCRLVATDTRRLALGDAPAAVRAGAGPPARPHLVPVKAVRLLERLLGGDGEAVKVALRPDDAVFRTDRATLHTKLLAGTFPPYRNILPKSFAASVPLAAGAFLAAVRQAAVMADDETRRVDFCFAPGAVTLAARGPHAGSGEVTLPLPGYAGPEVRIAFDPAYLTDMLRALDPAAALALEMTGGDRPAVFRLGTEYVYLVMPLAD